MSFFGLFGSAPGEPALTGQTVYLRQGRMEDFAAWRAARQASRAFLEPWEPIWPVDDLTKAGFRRRLRRQRLEWGREEALALLLFRKDDHALLGGLNIGQIRRGVAQTATIGYWMSAEHAGKGYMAQALRLALDFSFGQLRLHRVEAACLPTNARSIRLLEGSGFRREGLARAYLRIAGRWRDHLLYAVVEGDALPPPPPASRTIA
jgi:ribosomal-protein-alanine N-acetyltransferase